MTSDARKRSSIRKNIIIFSNVEISSPIPFSPASEQCSAPLDGFVPVF